MLVVLAFLLMLMSPCAVAMHASLAEEGPSLGYAASYRRCKARLIDAFRV